VLRFFNEGVDMQKQSGNIAMVLLIIAFAVLGIGGWVANIVKMIGSGFDPLTGLVIGRVIGVFVAPLGAVLGFV
jgi:hypothetical protein